MRDYDALRDLGVKLVINMRFEHRPRKDIHESPLQLLWLPSFDSPFVPISIKSLQRGVMAALETISKDGKGYAHCAGGVHRGVAMGTCILIAQGPEPESAMDLLKSRRASADPRIFYIRSRILKFAREWSLSK